VNIEIIPKRRKDLSKVIFITGASSGFGRACAYRFANNGWKLILTARRASRLNEIKEELSKITSLITIPLDIRDKKCVREAIDNLPKGFSTIDVLLNNAGLALGMEPAHECNIEDWEVMIDTNIKGLIYCTRYVLPQMVEKNRGHIINIGSIAGTWAYPGINVYGGTKAFVRQFSLNLRADLYGTKVRVSLLDPGMAKSEFASVRFKGDDIKANDVYGNAEVLKPSDIAEVVFWISSLPEHVNVNSMEVMPTCQTWGPLRISKNE